MRSAWPTLQPMEWCDPASSHRQEIRELREFTRYRRTQDDARAREIQRLEKALQDARIKITSFVSTLWSASSQMIIEALIAGERDPKVLAEMAKGRMRAKIPHLEEPLSGHFGTDHALLCRQIIGHIDFLDQSIAQLTKEITTRLVHFESAIAIVTSIPAIARTTAGVIIAETGADVSRFPSPGQLCAWAAVAPTSYESAGKRRPAGTRHGHHGCDGLSLKLPGPVQHEGKLTPSTICPHRTATGTKQGLCHSRQLDAVYHLTSAQQWPAP